MCVHITRGQDGAGACCGQAAPHLCPLLSASPTVVWRSRDVSQAAMVPDKSDVEARGAKCRTCRQRGGRWPRYPPFTVLAGIAPPLQHSSGEGDACTAIVGLYAGCPMT